MDQTVGISVNERLNSDDITCDGQPYLIQLKRWKKIAADFVKKDGTAKYCQRSLLNSVKNGLSDATSQ